MLTTGLLLLLLLLLRLVPETLFCIRSIDFPTVRLYLHAVPLFDYTGLAPPNDSSLARG